MVRAGKALGSGVGSVAQSLLTLFWMLLAAPGWQHFLFSTSKRCLFASFYSNMVWLCSHSRSVCVFYLFNLPSEGRQGTSVVSCNRMVPAGVSHVSPQRLLSDTVIIFLAVL